MFKCGITGRLSNSGDKPHRLVVERRMKEYFAPGAKPDSPPVLVGRGWEIVKEVNVTLDGLRIFCSENPDDAEAGEALARLSKIGRPINLTNQPL